MRMHSRNRADRHVPASGVRAILIMRMTMLLCAPLLPAQTARAEEILVSPGAGGLGLIEALQTAADGDTLLVSAGDYSGPLAVDASVILRGAGWPVIHGGGKGSSILITAPDVTIEGLDIRGSGLDMMHSDAGITVEGDRAALRGNRLSKNLFGIYLRRAGDCLIEDNRITGLKKLDIGSRGAGVHLYDSNRNILRKNRIEFTRDGIYFDHANNNLVEDNAFTDLRYGVHYMYCEDNRFFRNLFKDSMAGAAIMYTDRVEFSDNQILNNRAGFNAIGLLFQACRQCRCERNVILNNTTGIFLEGARDNLFANNLIGYNDLGIEYFGSSSDNTFTNNDFIENITTLHTVGPVTVTLGSEQGGNYYSDYEGYDLDQDGRGDLPHRLQDAFEHLAGNHPLLRLFLSSGAADALVLAERSFPVMPSSESQDRVPLMRPVSGAKVDPLAGKGVTPEPAPLAASLSLLATLGLATMAWRLKG
jgi:nitrous oxidase accessory protein